MKRPDPIAVLVAGSDQDASRGRIEALRAAGFEVEFASVDDGLVERLENFDCDAVLLEAAALNRPDRLTATCHALSEVDVDHRVPVLVCGDPDDSGRVVDAFDAGASDFVSSRVAVEELAARLRAHARGHRERQALRQATIRDDLTSLFNRTYFEDRLREELTRIERYGGDLGVLLVDLDNFKQINDRFGHAAGDAALRRTGEIIRDTVRQTDLAARFGGDEFAILLIGTETAHPGVVAERIRSAIETRSETLRPRVAPFTASIGATALAGRARDAEALVAEADSALYTSKDHGRNRATLFRIGRPSDSEETSDPRTGNDA